MCVRAPACLSVFVYVWNYIDAFLEKGARISPTHRGTHCFVIYNRKLNFNFLKDTANDWESSF